MPIFRYRGKKKNGEDIKGEIHARHREEAVELLSQQGVLPIAIMEHHVTSSAKNSKPDARILFKDTYLFTRQLSNLIKAGVPILRALEIIQQQTSHGGLKAVLDNIHQGIRDGKSFSDCLSEHPKVFSPLYIAMVRVGEEGGNLRETLVSISEYQRAQNEFLLKVRTALAYPIFMACVGFATVIFILTFVMPTISKLFLSAGQQLPLPTRILMQISYALRAGWFILIPAFVLIVFSLIHWIKSKKGRSTLDRLKLRLPLLGPFLLKVEFARFCRTLEILTKNGISLLRGIQIAVPTLDNELIRQDLFSVKAELESGNSLSKSFQKCRFVPVIIVNLISVGEESGLLTETLGDIADSYEEETAEAVKSFTAILEPLMILAVGSIVGFIVIAMLLPIFQMDVLAR